MTNIYALADGTTFYAWSWVNPLVKPFVEIVIDTNGTKGPNVYGKDIFIYYIFSQKEDVRYNGGTGNVATKVPRAGLYPDGYGYSREVLLNDRWRGCNKRGEKATYNDEERNNSGGAFCSALIMLDGWKISDDYKW